MAAAVVAAAAAASASAAKHALNRPTDIHSLFISQSDYGRPFGVRLRPLAAKFVACDPIRRRSPRDKLSQTMPQLAR